MLTPLRRWVKGDRFSAAHLNQPLDAIDAITPLLATGAASSVAGIRGTGIVVPQPIKPRPAYRAVIQNTMSSTNGIGLYDAHLIRELPEAIDITQDLDSNSQADTDPGASDIIIENEAERDTHNGNYLFDGDIVVCFPTDKQTDEDKPRKIYRTYYQPQIYAGKVTVVWAGPPATTIKVKRILANGKDGPGDPFDVVIPSTGNPQWCSFAVDDPVLYTERPDASGTLILIHNPLPRLVATYQGWYLNDSAIVVADWLRAADSGTGGGGGGGGGSSGVTTVYTVGP